MLAAMLAAAAIPTLLVFALAVGQSSPPTSAGGRRPLAAAEAALDSGDPGAALAPLDEALRANPEDADALMLLGRAMLSLERDEDAATAFRRAAEVRGETTPGGLDASCALADALTRLGRSREAIAVLVRVRDADPRRLSVNHDLGRIYLVVGELEAASKAFRAELALRPGGAARPGSDPVIASSWEGLGVASYRLGDDGAALEALAKAPATVEARYHTGLAQARQGRHDQAVVALRDVLGRDPEHRGALQAMARSAGALGRQDDRRDALARFAELYKKDEERRAVHVRTLELRTQAESLATSGDISAAVSRLREASALSPADMDIVLSLGRLLYASKDLKQAEQAFRTVIQNQPTHADARYRLGRLQADTGDLASAAQSLEVACRMSPMTVSYHVHLAQLYMRTGRAADAVRELRLARRLAPSDPESAFNLGLGLAQSGALAEAATELETAVTQGHRDPRVHQVLAEVYSRLGDAERSRREAETFRKLQAEAVPK
jgi:Flp pilus assembly protein TadD